MPDTLADVFEVTRRSEIPATVEQTWAFLTEPGLLGEWFADTSTFRLGQPFRFEFGDGDFFSGRVTLWQAPHMLGLCWRFMGIGPESSVRYSLTPDGETTIVTVHHDGIVDEQEVSSLGEGWDDFLMRLKNRITTGTSTRYNWSETVVLTCKADRLTRLADSPLSQQSWWLTAFPDTHVDIAYTGHDSAVANMEHARGGRTTARISLRQFGRANYLSVIHEGWTNLAAERRIAERRRCARAWTTAMAALEKTWS